MLTHLIGHVASVDVEDCMGFVESFPEEAKGFAEVDATQEDLEKAIESIAKHWKWKVKPKEKKLKNLLTQCFVFRKVIILNIRSEI